MVVRPVCLKYLISMPDESELRLVPINQKPSCCLLSVGLDRRRQSALAGRFCCPRKTSLSVQPRHLDHRVRQKLEKDCKKMCAKKRDYKITCSLPLLVLYPALSEALHPCSHSAWRRIQAHDQNKAYATAKRRSKRYQICHLGMSKKGNTKTRTPRSGRVHRAEASDDLYKKRVLCSHVKSAPAQSAAAGELRPL